MNDGQMRVFYWEVSNGFSWTRQEGNKSSFEETLHNFMRDLNATSINNIKHQVDNVLVVETFVHPYME